MWRGAAARAAAAAAAAGRGGARRGEGAAEGVGRGATGQERAGMGVSQLLLSLPPSGGLGLCKAVSGCHAAEMPVPGVSDSVVGPRRRAAAVPGGRQTKEQRGVGVLRQLEAQLAPQDARTEETRGGGRSPGSGWAAAVAGDLSQPAGLVAPEAAAVLPAALPAFTEARTSGQLSEAAAARCRRLFRLPVQGAGSVRLLVAADAAWTSSARCLSELGDPLRSRACKS